MKIVAADQFVILTNLKGNLSPLALCFILIPRNSS